MEDAAALVFERPYPSANSVLIRGPAPILIDPGFGSDMDSLIEWLQANGLRPDELACVVNTHYHSDHVGGNHVLQHQFGRPIAAHADDAALVNRRAPSVCAAEWLRQPVESYTVDRSLHDGATLDAGESRWTVLHTPGHTDGHISLYEPESRVLIGGDAVHASDVGWLNPYREHVDSLERSLDSLRKLEALSPRIVFSGHGPVITDPAAAFDGARRRLERWRSDPSGMAWHAAKRIFAYALMIEDGIAEADVDTYLNAAPWARDIAAQPFSMTPGEWTPVLVAEMLRSGAAAWTGGRLVACGTHTAPPRGWARTPTVPAQWCD
jgi:glyoxylase-like metal-dependent hydrolase (beta-lactamase superfamily II)